MRKLLLIPVIIILAGNVIFAHNTLQVSKAYQYLDKKGEVYFKCERPERLELQELTQVISIDKVDGYEVYAYANRSDFENFLNYNLEFQVLTHPGDMLENPAMTDYSNPEIYEWDEYPTYQGYLTMMQKFETDHPERCKIVEIGESIRKRKLLFAKISDNVNTDEPEPRFMYTSTMHGDETTGYVTMLRLIDYLLTKYSSDNYIKGLVDNIEIWIMPLENPDGTFRGGNNSVNGAIRANANGVDLNRNYPNPKNNPGNRQHETKIMMKFADERQFVNSMNFHGGAELLNYCFDSWTSGAYRPADNDWFNYVCRQFVNKVHDKNSRYMTGENNGVTLGGDWYIIFGSRMDYHGWYKHVREVTGEISSRKLLRPEDLPNHWNWLYESLLYYMEQCQYGIRGTVKDKDTKLPVCNAKIWAQNHDKDSSFVRSDTPHGDFYRPIYQGTYSLKFTHPDCEDKIESNIRVQNEKATEIEVEMDCDFVSNKNTLSKVAKDISILPFNNGVKVTYNIKGVVKTGIYDVNGRLIKVFPVNRTGNNYLVWNGSDNSGERVGNGCYIVKFTIDDATYTEPFILTR